MIISSKQYCIVIGEDNLEDGFYSSDIEIDENGEFTDEFIPFEFICSFDDALEGFKNWLMYKDACEKLFNVSKNN